MSRIDLTPEHTTSTGTAASVARSADTSQLVDLCTPPRPPVANTSMPARPATARVPATVVAPAAPHATAGPRSRRDSLATLSKQSRSSWSLSQPATAAPSSTAMVAGTAPWARTVASSRSATSLLRRAGGPGASGVASGARAGRPVARAPATSSCSRSGMLTCGIIVHVSLQTQTLPDTEPRPEGTDRTGDDDPKLFHYVRKSKIA